MHFNKRLSTLLRSQRRNNKPYGLFDNLAIVNNAKIGIFLFLIKISEKYHEAICLIIILKVIHFLFYKEKNI